MIAPMKNVTQPPAQPDPGTASPACATASAFRQAVSRLCSSGGGKALRSDGVEARNRLLDAALVLFAEKGFSKTSTREIALAAQVNVASISYYFGDKAGLYRAVFEDPRSNPGPDMALLSGQYTSLREVLRAMVLGFTEPLKQGDLVQCCMRLHFREMLEPTGVWQAEINNSILPMHTALVKVLCTHLGVDAAHEADDDIHRLAITITGLGLMVQVSTDCTTVLRPSLIATPEAVDRYTDRLVAYAEALVECEARRRRPAHLPHPNTPPLSPNTDSSAP